MTSGAKVTRRSLLSTGGAVLAASHLPACDVLSTDPDSVGGTDGVGRAAREAAALAQRVTDGTLPPLPDRLPKSPLTVKPIARPGQYGGILRSFIPGVASASLTSRVVEYDLLMRWSPDFSELIPNIAESVDIESDGRAYTFHLRPGMRWSDGELFTASDLIYAVEDVLLNDEIYPIMPDWLAVADVPAEIEELDQHTVQFRFAEPNGLFLPNLARTTTEVLTRQPRHYLEQFHRKYGSDVEKLVDDEGFSTWQEFYLSKSENLENPELPTLCAWQPRSRIEGSRVIFDRNPYYWKVDTDGRQLPYIDEVTFAVIDDSEVILLAMLQGELDFELSSLYLNSLKNKPVLAGGREDGGYHFNSLKPGNMNYLMVSLNLCHQDTELRELFQNKDFRIGLSHAIDREEIIKVVFKGQAEPWQGGPRPDSDLCNDVLAKQYTEFHPDRAISHLDSAGLRETDDEGFRLHAGKRLRIVVEVPDFQDYYSDVLELVKEHWSEVGVELLIKSEDRSLFYERKEANLHDAAVYVGEYGSTWGVILDPRWYLPFSSESNYAIPWAQWFSSAGRKGQQPPAEAIGQMDLYASLQATADPAERLRLSAEILRIAQEQFWVIGIAMPTQGYGIVSNRLHNVPADVPDSYIYLNPGPTNLEQYFFDTSQPSG